MSDLSAADRIYGDGEIPEDADFNAPDAAHGDGGESEVAKPGSE